MRVLLGPPLEEKGGQLGGTKMIRLEVGPIYIGMFAKYELSTNEHNSQQFFPLHQITYCAHHPSLDMITQRDFSIE